MKKFSIIHIPLLSFFSKELYRDVALNWKGVGAVLGYLLLLLAVCWIPAMVEMHIGFANFVDNEAPKLVEQVPEIKITDGQVSIEQPQPYYINDPDSNDVLAIIDTTATITSLEDPNAMCLLTKNNIMWRESELEIRTIDLPEVKNFVLNSERIMGWLHTAGKFLVIIIYPFALLGSYLYRIVQALIYAAIGLLFAKWCKIVLPYLALLRLAIVAVTPCIIVSTVFSVADVYLPYGWLFYLLVALGYLFYAVNACSQTPPAQQDTQFPQEGIWARR